MRVEKEMEVVVGENETTAVDEDESINVTPIKLEPQIHAKKAFLRRGSSAKYDPQQARKQSQGSLQKFKYYTDNFSKNNASSKVKAAPRGASGIP